MSNEKRINGVLKLMVKGYGLEYVKREVKKEQKIFTKI